MLTFGCHEVKAKFTRDMTDWDVCVGLMMAVLGHVCTEVVDGLRRYSCRRNGPKTINHTGRDGMKIHSNNQKSIERQCAIIYQLFYSQEGHVPKCSNEHSRQYTSIDYVIYPVLKSPKTICGIYYIHNSIKKTVINKYHNLLVSTIRS